MQSLGPDERATHARIVQIHSELSTVKLPSSLPAKVRDKVKKEAHSVETGLKPGSRGDRSSLNFPSSASTLVPKFVSVII